MLLIVPHLFVVTLFTMVKTPVKLLEQLKHARPMLLNVTNIFVKKKLLKIPVNAKNFKNPLNVMLMLTNVHTNSVRLHLEEARSTAKLLGKNTTLLLHSS